jgi:1,4-alpha-glucan branching enzyme
MSDQSVESVKAVRFEAYADPYSEVFVAGSFNGWNPKHSRLSDETGSGLFSLTTYLPLGIYEYKFVINDVWCADPACPDWTANSMGTLNSVLTVDK